MAHLQQKVFCEEIRNRFPNSFTCVIALDVGSLDINGNNSNLFDDLSFYTGLDIIEGRNVDTVCPVHEYKTSQKFDTIVSTECFEHDQYYKESLNAIITLLKPNGLFLFTCATEGREEHGTSRVRPEESPATVNYYKNLTIADIQEVIPIDDIFKEYEFRIDPESKTLMFWGIKKEEI